MSEIVGPMIFGLPLIVDSFAKGYAIIPAFFCALLFSSRRLKARTKLALSMGVLVTAALYVAATSDPGLLLAAMLLMLPAVAILTLVFVTSFRLLRIVGDRYDHFLDGGTGSSDA